MATTISEVCDAGGVSDKARTAAEPSAAFETRFAETLGRMDRLEGRMNTVTWMVGMNITLTLLVLGRLFLVRP